jgi:hypothetical protein
MKLIAFFGRPQSDVIEKVLRHSGLWYASRAPPQSDGRPAPSAEDGWGHDPDSDSDESRELTCVDIDMVEATF